MKWVIFASLIAFSLAACSLPSPEAAKLSMAEICANAPETRALIRDYVQSEPGMVDLACLIVEQQTHH
jgi:hypothetical protein